MACGRCGTPLPHAVRPSICARCQKDPPPFAVAHAPLHFAFPVDAALKALKFRRRIDLAPMLAELALPWLLEHARDFDALLPVPLHRFRNATRGFNQAEELARRLRKATGLPLIHTVSRCRGTKSQSGLSARDRKRNMRGAFRVKTPFVHRNPLVVDDVMTTGETCRELARAVLAAGAVSVGVLSIARAAPRP